MRLRRVAMSGFKTFARRSEITLEPGITAIVGPNGSGKSNLVDAIRWALGETNARELRGARMDEVIYSGGDGRGRMGFAEVELVLDNEDGRLPVEDSEVSVSRRVVRHGDSEYRLNGDRVRLRDLERVLAVTGLTQSGYAVVAQNDIDAIIEATPSQRRALVEQAAGVRSLRAASEDALARVRSAEATLQRFEDLLAETEPRLAELAQQAELALEQRALTDRLAQLRGSLAREAWRGARAQLRKAQRRLEAATARLAAAQEADTAFQRRLDQQRGQLERRRAEQVEAAARLQQSRITAERLHGDLRRQSDQVRVGALHRAQAAVEVRAAAAELAARSAEVDALAAVAEAHPGTVERARAQLVQSEAAHAGAGEALRAAELRAAEADRALRGTEERRALADDAVRRHAAQSRVLDETTATLQARLKQARSQAEMLTLQANAAAQAVQAAEASVTAAEEAQQVGVAAVAARRTAVTDASAVLDTAREAARVSLARAATLHGQVEGALGGRGAIADAVDARELVAGRLVDAFTVRDPADRAAVEAALEAHLGAWIVDDLEHATGLLVHGAAREELLRRQVPPPADAVLAVAARPAITAIDPRPDVEALLATCLAGAWLCPDSLAADAALAAGAARVVLPDGTVLTSIGRRGGGRPGHTLELAASERRAAQHAADATEAERAAEAGRRRAQEELAGAEVAERGAADDLAAARLQFAEATAGAQATRARLEVEANAATTTEQELADRLREREALDEALSAASAAHTDAEHEVLELRAAAAGARELVQRAAADVSRLSEGLRAIQAELAEHLAAATEHRRHADVAEAAQRSARERLSAAEVRMLGAELEVLAGIAWRRALLGAVRTATATVDSSLEGMSTAAPDLAALERSVAALQAERSELAVVLARAQDEEAAAAQETAAAGARADELAAAVRDDADDEGPEPEEGDSERAEREIVRLERRVAALGPVNALAPEEHDRVALRVALLRAGRDDLGGACADIRHLAAYLVREVDERFEAVFGAVSAHFHELFAELFPGGRATLRREQDVAASAPPAQDAAAPAGVEILAQPPGKRLQPLSLFSGGERALTALAVILALQQVNPSPFYVFDEVDAPLDDSNVIRFCGLLKRLSQDQQFIVVTHNHITMAAADALHGVTSDGDGVSSVISVRFDPDSGEAVPDDNVVGLRQSTIRAAV